jgi:hypothetical protein
MKRFYKKKKDNSFANFLFEGFELKNSSNKYLRIAPINETKTKVILSIPTDTLFHTKYGAGVRLTPDTIIWVKSWQFSEVNVAVYGGENEDEVLGYARTYSVVFDKAFTKISQNTSDLEAAALEYNKEVTDENLWDTLLEIAAQEEEVKFENIGWKIEVIEPEKLEVKDEAIIDELTVDSIK